MNYTDQDYRLAREVLYLHSLWHQGPPNSNSNSSSRHIPYPCHDHPTFYQRTSSPNPYYNRYPSSRTPERSNKKHKRDSSQEKEWPCDPASAPEQSSPHTWPQFEQAVQNPSLSPNSAARCAFVATQRLAIQSCKGFFCQGSDSESECESGLENDVDDFFMSLLENNVGLRGCYEKSSDNAEFYCLVCESRRDGNKGKGKMYRGCAALAQHATSIKKVGCRAAHRAFARSICRVLGWDPQRLPSIVLLPGSAMKVDHFEDKQETVAIQITKSTSDISEVWKRDTNDGPSGSGACSPTEVVPEASDVPGSGASSPTEQETLNVPGSGACSPTEVVPEAGDSGAEKASKEKDLDLEYSDGIVLKTVDYASDKQKENGTTSEEAINHVKFSGSPVEEKKKGTSFDAWF